MREGYVVGIAALMAVSCLLAGVASATVADLEALQSAGAAHAFSFEGTYNPTDGTGTWLDNKVAPTPDLAQTLFESHRIADQAAGYDGTTSSADFLAWASGGKGDGLTATPLTYANFGTIEYLVQFGTMDSSSHFMVSGDGAGGSNDRFQFLIAYGGGTDKAQMTIGANTPVDMIGGTAAVAYQEGDWYYVAQNWGISGATATMDAWVANLTDGGALTKTVNGVVNSFAGDGNAELYLANLVNLANYFADGGLDAVAVYDSQLGESTIQSHFAAIPEPGTLGLLGIAFFGMLVVRGRRCAL